MSALTPSFAGRHFGLSVARGLGVWVFLLDSWGLGAAAFRQDWIDVGFVAILLLVTGVLIVRTAFVADFIHRYPRYVAVGYASYIALMIFVSGGFASDLHGTSSFAVWLLPVIGGFRMAVWAAAGYSAAEFIAIAAHHLLFGDHVGVLALAWIGQPYLNLVVSICLFAVLRSVFQGMPAFLEQTRFGLGEAASTPMGSLLLNQGSNKLLIGRPSLIIERLTPAERDILRLLVEGKTPQQIALKRNAATSTVYAQIESIKKKTGARTTEQLGVLRQATKDFESGRNEY